MPRRDGRGGVNRQRRQQGRLSTVRWQCLDDPQRLQLLAKFRRPCRLVPWGPHPQANTGTGCGDANPSSTVKSCTGCRKRGVRPLWQYRTAAADYFDAAQLSLFERFQVESGFGRCVSGCSCRQSDERRHALHRRVWQDDRRPWRVAARSWRERNNFAAF